MNESKSQPSGNFVSIIFCCYKYQNINERKQITTLPAPDTSNLVVVANIRISMNESKSQLLWVSLRFGKSCYKYQNINERKQITTRFFGVPPHKVVVTNIRISMNESKSQPKHTS